MSLFLIKKKFSPQFPLILEDYFVFHKLVSFFLVEH